MPSRRPIRKLFWEIATSLTTGLLPLAITTSSPASAASMSLDKLVFAACTVTCMTTTSKLAANLAKNGRRIMSAVPPRP